jgi:hypothetical protein
MEILAWCGVGLLYLFMGWLWPSTMEDKWWVGVFKVHIIGISLGGGVAGIVYLYTH